jgi:hypothetical protein
MNVPDGSYSAGQAGEPGQQRWFVLGVVGLAQLIGAAMFGIFLFLTYYLQTILGRPVTVDDVLGELQHDGLVGSVAAFRSGPAAPPGT